jgi:hypothetical protein
LKSGIVPALAAVGRAPNKPAFGLFGWRYQGTDLSVPYERFVCWALAPVIKKSQAVLERSDILDEIKATRPMPPSCADVGLTIFRHEQFQSGLERSDILDEIKSCSAHWSPSSADAGADNFKAKIKFQAVWSEATWILGLVRMAGEA